jgi:hypothetical protein
MDFKKGDEVYDTWYPYSMGRVVEVLKTRMKIKFYMVRRAIVYDKAHYRFLRKVKENGRKIKNKRVAKP